MFPTFADSAASQVPPPGAITLDHLAYFVPGMSDASAPLRLSVRQQAGTLLDGR